MFAALTLSGIWRTAALEFDLLLARLAREWDGRSRVVARGLQPIGQLIGLLARGAAAGRKLTERHARLAARVDDRLLRLAH